MPEAPPTWEETSEVLPTWEDTSPVEKTPDLSRVKLSPYEQAVEARGGMKPESGMESGSELLTSVFKDPLASAKLIPDIIGGVMTAPGKLARAASADLMSKAWQSDSAIHKEYGGNLAALKRGEDVLPVDKFIGTVARTHPNAAVGANLAQSAVELAPSLGMAGLPGWINRLIAGGFSLKMISSAPEEARQLGDEMGRPKDQQDPAKIAQLKSALIQTGVFAPLAGAGALSRTTLPRATREAMASIREKGAADASRLREDAGQVPPPGNEPVGSEVKSSADLEQPTPGEPRGATPGAEAQAPEKGQQGVLLDEAQQDPVYLAEREAIDNPDKIKFVAELPNHQRWPKHMVASIDRTTGEILLNPEEYLRWRQDMMRRGLSEDQQRKALRMLVGEEGIHLATSDADAEAWAKKWTKFEKALSTKIYTGEWTLEKAGKRHGRSFSDKDIAYEDIRNKLQRLARERWGTSSEASEFVGKQRLGIRALETLNDIVFNIRKSLGTKASAEQLQMLDRIKGNLDLAVVAVGGNPFKLRKDEERRSAHDFQPALLVEGKPVTGGADHGSIFKSQFPTAENKMGLYEAFADDKKHVFVDKEGKVYSRAEAADQLGESEPLKSERLTELKSQPGALRRGKETSEQGVMFLPPVARGTEIQRPSAVEAGAKIPNRFEIEKAAYAHLQDTADKAASAYEANPHEVPDIPSFKSFYEHLQNNFGGIQKGAAFEFFERNLWRMLTNARGAKLEAFRKALKLEGRLGTRSVLDPVRSKFAPEQEGESGAARQQMKAEERGTTGNQRYRSNLISQIGQKMLADAGQEITDLKTEVSAEDLRYGDTETTEPTYWQVSRDDWNDPKALGTKLVADARRSSKDPESVTKRLTLLVDQQTGKAYLVSTYKHGRLGAVLRDPALKVAKKVHRPLEQIMGRYRPVTSMLLDQPVQNFLQEFSSLGEYEAKMGTDARRAAEPLMAEPPRIEGQEEQPGSWERSVPMTQPEAIAMLDHIFNEVGEFTGPEDVIASLSALKEAPNRTALSGFRKLAAYLERQNPDLSLDELRQKLAEHIYETHKSTATGRDFSQRILQETTAAGREAAGLRPERAAAQELLRSQALKSQAKSGARDLTMAPRLPPTVTRGEVLPKGPGPAPEIGGVKQPGALRRPVDDSIGKIRALFARRPQKQELSALVDAANTEAVLLSEQSKRDIEQPSSSKQMKHGDAEIKAAAFAINAAYDPSYQPTAQQGGGAYPSTGLDPAAPPSYPDPAKLNDWLAAVQHGQAKARTIIANPTPTALVAVGLPDITGVSGHQIRALGQDWLAAGQKLEREVRYAIDHFDDPALMETTTRFRESQTDQLRWERAHGKDVKEALNYAQGIYEGELYGDNSVTFQSIELGKSYAKPKTFANRYAAIEAGPFIPKAKGVADSAAHRIRSGVQSVLRDEAFRATLNLTDPLSGSPVAIDAEASRGGGYQVPGGNLQYRLVYPLGGGKPMAVRRGYAKLVEDLFGRSGIEDWVGGRAAMQATALEKHTTLAGDIYHLNKMTFYALALTRQRMGYRGALAALEFKPQNLAEAVRRGVIRQKDMDWALRPHTVLLDGQVQSLTRQQILREFASQGANIGRIQDAMYRHFVDEMDVTIGGRRIGIGSYNRFLFNDWTRGLMGNSMVEEFLRLSKASPSTDGRTIIGRISKDINTMFGSTGKQAIVKNPTLRDINQMVWLAPQWTGSRIASEAKFLTRLATTPYIAATKGRGAAQLEFGSIGRGIGTGLLFMVALTQAINLISRKKFTWQNEENKENWSDALTAYMPDVTGGPDHKISPLSVFMEILHDVARYRAAREGKEDLGAVISKIASNKLSPLARAGMVLGSGYTPMGQKITGGLPGRLYETGKAAVPFPITISAGSRLLGHAVAPGLVSPNAPGALQRQLVSSAGIKSETDVGPVGHIMNLAHDFIKREGLEKSTGWTQQQTDEPGYTKLRAALRAKDEKEIRRNLEALRRTRTDEQIKKSMERWSNAGFTGNQQHESDFKNSLDERQLELYDRAREQKQQEYRDWLDWLWQNS